GTPGQLGQSRAGFERKKYDEVALDANADKDAKRLAGGAKEKAGTYELARESLGRGQNQQVQAGKLGVDLSLQTCNLKNQCRMEYTARRRVASRNCMEVGGVWIDDGFDAKTPAVTVKAQSNAYFRILERHPEVREVFQLGNYLVWITPSGTALVIDTTDGKEE